MKLPKEKFYIKRKKKKKIFLWYNNEKYCWDYEMSKQSFIDSWFGEEGVKITPAPKNAQLEIDYQNALRDIKGREANTDLNRGVPKFNQPVMSQPVVSQPKQKDLLGDYQKVASQNIANKYGSAGLGMLDKKLDGDKHSIGDNVSGILSRFF